MDKLVGEAIEAWEKQRPAQAKLVDTKTGEQVDFLLLYRFRQVDHNLLEPRRHPEALQESRRSQRRCSRQDRRAPRAGHDRHSFVQRT
ncbi:MAG TPA: hypothetical protein VNX18_05290 [Bryobacteraceae bacterium]|nr:hypothetical protein [Bryobacteraceae bacterium]